MVSHVKRSDASMQERNFPCTPNMTIFAEPGARALRPVGTAEMSPALQCWEEQERTEIEVPSGTTELVAWLQSQSFMAGLARVVFKVRSPSTKVLGYCQSSRWDEDHCSLVMHPLSHS